MLQLTMVVEAMIVGAATSKQAVLNLRYAQLSRCPRRIESSRVVQLQALQRKVSVLLLCLLPLHPSRPLMLLGLSRTMLQDLGSMV